MHLDQEMKQMWVSTFTQITPSKRRQWWFAPTFTKGKWSTDHEVLALWSGHWEMHSDNFLACACLMANEVTERMCSGKDISSSLRSSSELIFFGETNSVYSLLAQLRPFPCLMTWSTFRFSTQMRSTVEPANVWCRGVNPCLILLNTVTCLCWTPISLQVILRHICLHHHHAFQGQGLWQKSPCIQKLNPDSHRNPCTMNHAAKAHLVLYCLFLYLRAWNFY